MSETLCLYKGKGSWQDPDRWRPIAKSNSIFRLLMRWVYRTLYPLLSPLLHPRQFGGRQGTSRAHAMQTVLHDIDHLDNFEAILAFDVYHAFDRPLRHSSAWPFRGLGRRSGCCVQFLWRRREARRLFTPYGMFPPAIATLGNPTGASPTPLPIIWDAPEIYRQATSVVTVAGLRVCTLYPHRTALMLSIPMAANWVTPPRQVRPLSFAMAAWLCAGSLAPPTHIRRN